MNKYNDVVEILKNDGVILVPTDTNYGIAVDPWSEIACKRAYEIKNRSIKKPLTIFVSNEKQVRAFIDFEKVDKKTYEVIVSKYWPGPLNIVFEKSDEAPNNKYFNENTISIAFNKNETLNEIIKEFGRPLALTSANISGIDSNELIDVNSARNTFCEMVDYIVENQVESGDTTCSSTIIKLKGKEVFVLRSGDIVF